jgi:hypothetical protein
MKRLFPLILLLVIPLARLAADSTTPIDDVTVTPSAEGSHTLQPQQGLGYPETIIKASLGY